MKCPRTHLHLLHRRPHQPLPRFIQHPILPHLRRSHVPIALQRSARKTLALPFPRPLDPFPNLDRGLAQPVPGEFVVLHPRHFDVNIDAVQQWTGDSFLVFRHDRRCTGAWLLAVPVIATGTGIHRSNQHYTGGIFHRETGAGDADLAVFQRLTHYLQNSSFKLR